jgi:hypothetical protein
MLSGISEREEISNTVELEIGFSSQLLMIFDFDLHFMRTNSLWLAYFRNHHTSAQVLFYMSRGILLKDLSFQ